MLKKIVMIVDVIVILLLSLYAAMFCIPAFVGIKPVNVLSGSMEPSIKTGSIAYIKETDIDEVHRDDVIAFALGNDSLVLHRVKEINPKNKITTQGDANDNEDFTMVSEEQLRGKMIFQIPYAGFVYQKVTQSATVILLVLYAGLTIGYKIVCLRKEEAELIEDDIEDIRL